MKPLDHSGLPPDVLESLEAARKEAACTWVTFKLLGDSKVHLYGWEEYHQTKDTIDMILQNGKMYELKAPDRIAAYEIAKKLYMRDKEEELK